MALELGMSIVACYAQAHVVWLASDNVLCFSPPLNGCRSAVLAMSLFVALKFRRNGLYFYGDGYIALIILVIVSTLQKGRSWSRQVWRGCLPRVW